MKIELSPPSTECEEHDFFTVEIKYTKDQKVEVTKQCLNCNETITIKS